MGNNKQDEFYIGWMGKAPATFAAFVKKYLLVLLPVVLMVAVLLAVAQRKFGTGNFEFGTLTTVTGVYFDKPVPCIRVATGRDIFGNETNITVILIGYGKFGAEGIIADIEKAKGTRLNGKQVKLMGTMLYNDGKVIMQVDGNDTPLVNVDANASPVITAVAKQLGNVEIKGEIIDPKCYFGVMKPGEGKPHMDCAIRCILGGMPPMLHALNGKGASNYYLIVGANGEKINSTIKDFIAAPVEITANAVQYNDWIVLYVNPSRDMHTISKSAFFQPAGRLIACAAGGCR